TFPEVAAELDRLTRDPHAAIREAIVRLPLELCRDGVDLLDTPGLNDSEAMNLVTLSVLPGVDAAVLLLIPESPLSETERRFLEDHLMARDVGRIVFVMNAKDRVPPAQLPRISDYVQKQIERIVAARDASAAKHAKLICISSRAELNGGGDSGFPDLRRQLDRLLFEQRGRLLLGQALQRVRRAVGESLAALQLRVAQIAASRDGFLASLADIERQLATTRVYSNDLRRRVVEAQAEAESFAAKHAKQLHNGLLSLRESLPPQVTIEHTKGGPEKIGTRLGSALQQNAGRYFQHSLTSLHADVRRIYQPVSASIRGFIETAHGAFVVNAAKAIAGAPQTDVRRSGELELPDPFMLGSPVGLRIDLSIGALSWLYLMESANSLFTRGDIHSTLEARALDKLRVTYAQEIERQVKSHASEAMLTVRFSEFARRPFNELMRRLDQELKVLLDDAAATLASLRASAGQGADRQQVQNWRIAEQQIHAASEDCERIVFAEAEEQEGVWQASK
ncbi:MAG: hypothetical protein JO022_14610, partial [Acidobacteriaceae bacterium]|nr:hypothetical protein [Acidobacteriaceae bacterium]